MDIKVSACFAKRQELFKKILQMKSIAIKYSAKQNTSGVIISDKE
jgi:hypothetical protein